MAVPISGEINVPSSKVYFPSSHTSHRFLPPVPASFSSCTSQLLASPKSRNFAAVSIVSHSQPGDKAFYEVSRISYRGQGNLKCSWGSQVYCGNGKVSIDQAEANEELQVENRLLSPNESFRDKRIFIFGFGYTSCALASYLKKNNWEVSGTCRSEERRISLEQCGFTTFLFNSDSDGEELRGDGLRKLQQASHWMTSVPPVADFDRDPVLATHFQNLAEATREGSVRWIGYLSSTGVYGDWQGEWVDEESEPRPVEQRAVARLAAERAWFKFGLDNHVPVHVFRLGGIYGPERSSLDIIVRNGALSGRQKYRERRRFTSRIHVADICQIIHASMEKPCSGRIYNVVDDDPSPRNEVLAYAQGLLEKSMSHHDFRENVYSPREVLYGSNFPTRMEEKRVSNKRIKQELEVQLLHSSYTSGLQAILDLSRYQETS